MTTTQHTFNDDVTMAMSHLLALARGFEYAEPDQLDDQARRITQAVNIYDTLIHKGPSAFEARQAIRAIWREDEVASLRVPDET